MTLTTEQLRTFKIARYEFQLRACVAAVLPPFLGSTLRGSFGHALKAVACSMPHGECGRCFLVERCLYPKLFETSARKSSGLLGKGEDAPRPFIFIPPQPARDSGFLRARDNLLRWRVRVEAGQQLTFGFTLLGDACVDLPYVIYAVSLMAQHGFGVERASFELEAVTAIDANGSRTLIYTPEMVRLEPYEHCETTLGAMVQTRLIELARECLPKAQYSVAAATAFHREGNFGTSAVTAATPSAKQQSAIGDVLTLCFLTPTRMRIKGELLENPSFAQLIRSLSLRLSMLVQIHARTPLSYDYKSMIAGAESVRTTASSLRLIALDRRSNSQGAKLRMDGFMGEISFAGAAIADLLPLIVAGEFLHLGSGTLWFGSLLGVVVRSLLLRRNMDPKATLDLSLRNESLYAGCEIDEVAGRLTLLTQVSDAVQIVGRNAQRQIESLAAEGAEEITLTGAMAIWAYLVVFHSVVHRFRRVYYDDGKPNGKVLIAAH